MSIATRQRRIATAWTALLIVGAVLVLLDLARVVLLDLTHSNRPSDRRCAELWNGPANQTNRSLVRGRSFPLATVRGVEPNKGVEPERGGQQPGCSVLLREHQDGPWWSFGAALTETGVDWDPGLSGLRYGTDSPSGSWDDSPNATLQADGTLTLSDR
jgi:hypothetical protein